MGKDHGIAMRRLVFFSVLLGLPFASASPQIGGTAGAFSRLGFGARGIGMGNAMTAVTEGDLVGYYNPAVLAQAEYRNVSLAFGILPFDRKLNFLNYTQPVEPSAGIFLGVINSSVSNIDGRDSEGEPTGALQTTENIVMLGFATRLRSGLSIGINLKLLYHHLYTDVNSTTVGIDFGALVPAGDHLTLGASVRDINSKYKWDTSDLYGEGGRTTENKFPQLITIGAAYRIEDSLALVSAEIEKSNQATLTARVGIEVPLIKEVTVRAGIDRIDLKDKGNGIRPSFGFTARRDFDGWTPGVNYAFVLEPFTGSPTHFISLSLVL
jgi:opacity protein-like surface antigen